MLFSSIKRYRPVEQESASIQQDDFLDRNVVESSEDALHTSKSPTPLPSSVRYETASKTQPADLLASQKSLMSCAVGLGEDV